MARRGRYRMNLNKAAKELRRKEALERGEKRAGMSDLDKLQALDKNLGPGVGAKRERAKLAKRLAASVPKKVEAAAESKGPVGRLTSEDTILCQEGAMTMVLRAGQVQFPLAGGRSIPVISMSQIRRIADQHEFEAGPFLKAYKAHLATTEKA